MTTGTKTFLLFCLLLTGCATPPTQSTQPASSVAELTAINLAAQQADEASLDAPGPKDAGDDAQPELPPSEPVLFPGTDRVVGSPAPRRQIEVSGDSVTLRFERAPLNEVVHAILGDLLELDYSVMQPLQGEVSLHTHRPVPREQLLGILESMLLSNGYLMQADGNGRISIGAREAMRTNMPPPSAPGAASSGYSTVVVPLQYVGVTEMADILRPVSSAENVLRVDTARNLLMLAGTSTQIEGWLELIDIFDVDFLRGMSVGLFPLTYLSVDEAELALRSVFALTGSAAGGAQRSPARQEGDAPQRRQAPARAASVTGGPLAGLVQVLPVERLNALLVVTPRAHYLEQARLWIERFDRAADSEGGKQLFVYEVQNGAASHIARVLNGIFGGGGGGSSRQARSRDTGIAPGLAGAAVGDAQTFGAIEGNTVNEPDTTQVQLDNDVKVVADELNNALLIYATRREYRRIEAALRQIDLAPTQVLIEASILEVTLNDELQYGMQWFFTNALGGLGEGYEGVGQLTSTSTGRIGPNNPGFSYSISSPTGSFRAVLTALAEKSLLNVISTPTMMVLDNHTAAIRVGDQQPVRTSETTNLDGDNVTSTIEFKDTGVFLEVSPSVNAGGMVTMSVRQSITDVGQIDIATGQRTFLERELASRVAVRSGETIVLGGLIRDNSSRDRQGIPFLHDLPVVGNLFGTTNTSTDRTELLVVITPRVVTSEQDMRDVSRELRDRMRSLRDLPAKIMSGYGGGGAVDTSETVEARP
jgi:general secretion pathway protein D